MSKSRQSNKEVKKQPVLSRKEKKSAKQVKKHHSDIVDIVSHIPR